MRFKLDENIPPEVAAVLAHHGHDAVTVRQQQLVGCPDTVIIDVCCAEDRVLVTLDLDFSDIRRYPPHDHSGIIVLRVGDQSRKHVLSIFGRLIELLETEPLRHRLWIVQEHSVRVRE